MAIKKILTTLTLLFLITTLFVGAVSAGTVTIHSDSASYYVGNQITLSGTNTETDEVYLYVKGSNKQLQVIPSDTGRLTSAIIVDSDNTWEKKFTFASIFDRGTYTLYAVGNAYEYNPTTYEVYSLTDTEKLYPYATTVVTLKQPFLSATAASNTIAKGDKIKITGIAEGSPSAINYFIFGTSYFNYNSVTPEDDGTYEIEINTGDLLTGQYFIVVQHPMYDGFFNVVAGYNTSTYTKDTTNYKYVVSSWATNTDGTIEKPARDIIPAINTRQTANTAQSVCNLIDEEYVDDIYVKLDFVVANAYITINSISNQKKGATFTISGTTNVAVGEDVVIDVISTKFLAEPKASIPESSYLVKTTKIVAGANGVNTYSATFDGTQLAEDYYVAVATITRGSSTDDLKVSTRFNIGSASEIPIIISNCGISIISSSVTPRYTDSIADNTEVTYETIIWIPSGSKFYSPDLTLITDLNSPAFGINYYRKGAPLSESYVYGSIYKISGWSISYGNEEIYLFITATGTYSKSMGEIKLFGVSASDSPELSYTKTYGQKTNDVHFADSISIKQGWNFISIPKTLESSNNTAKKVFEGIDTDGKSILLYNSQTKTWETLKENTLINPLNGYWIYSKTDDTIGLTYKSDPITPPAKSVYKGWNAVGLGEEKPTPAQNVLDGTDWVKVRQWNIENKKYETAITRNGIGDSSPDKLINLKNGYWLYVNSDGTLT